MQAPDPILVLRAQTGDRDALDALLRMCQSPLHRYIAGLVGDATAAEDVLQECLFRIARKLKWLSDPFLFRAWAFRIASRESQRYTSRHREASSIEDADMPSIEPEALTAMELATVRHAVTTLSPASRAIVSLHYFEEMPLPEIAEALEIPLGTVKSRLWYGLKQLRTLVRKG